MESALIVLLALACPIGMGAMMWMMARGMGSGNSGDASGELNRLRADRERLSSEVERLERERAGEGEPARR